MRNSAYILSNDTYLKQGRYKITRKIAQGGFGITYQAFDTQQNKSVAIKECFLRGKCVRYPDATIGLQGLSPDEFTFFKNRFIQEGKTLEKFDHISIVKIQDIFEANNTAYLVMPLIVGNDLQNYIKKNGILKNDDAKDWMMWMANALKHVHGRRFLHRDIKPGNIMVDTHSSRIPVPVLVDFGNAKEQLEEKQKVSATNSKILTPGYAPLEQYQTKAKIANYSDIYSLGATLYYALTGVKPLDAIDRDKDPAKDILKAPLSLNANVSPHLNHVILKSMSMNIEHRYQNVDELLRDIKNPTTKPTAKPKVIPTPTPPKPTRPKPTPPKKEQPLPKPNPVWLDKDKPAVKKASPESIKIDIPPTAPPVKPPPPPKPPEKSLPKKQDKKSFIWVWWMLLAMLLGGGGYAGYEYAQNQYFADYEVELVGTSASVRNQPQVLNSRKRDILLAADSLKITVIAEVSTPNEGKDKITNTKEVKIYQIPTTAEATESEMTVINTFGSSKYLRVIEDYNENYYHIKYEEAAEPYAPQVFREGLVQKSKVIPFDNKWLKVEYINTEGKNRTGYIWHKLLRKK